MAKDINTIEEARAEILRLEEELEARTTERDTLSQNNETLTRELDVVRKLNQEQFNKLRAQNTSQEDEDEDEGDTEPISCEDFARTLNIL